MRDGEAALELALRCVQLTRRKDARALEALAAAQAEVGDFDAAIEAQREALELTPAEARGPLRSRLGLFEAETPYRLGAGGEE